MSLPLPPQFGRCLPILRTPPLEQPGPRSRAWLRRLSAVESINTTYAGDARGDGAPIAWTAARGANVLDADGNCFIDGTAGFAVATLGHANPRILRAAAAQAAELTHGLGDVHPTPVKVRLLETLARLCPQPAHGPPIAWKSILALSGAEAVVAALKTACVAAGKPGVLAFHGGYHGLTHGALLATARPIFRRPVAGQLAPVTRFAAWPDRWEALRAGRRATSPAALREAALREVARLLAAGEHSRTPIGALIVEPVQGRGGDRAPPPGFLAGLRRLADRAGALLIFDEIYCGLGRTGRLFAAEHEQVLPDLFCLGKALAGGFPLSACVGRAAVIDAWGPSQGEALHTSTFLGHPVGCAAALASLAQLRSPAFLRSVRERGGRFFAALRKRLQKIPQVAEVRGLGWIGAVELVQDRRTGQPDTARALAAVAGCLARGVILLPCGDANHCLSITPPACLTDAQARWVLDTIVEAIASGTAAATAAAAAGAGAAAPR
ncbi:MAG: aspartate aminotransferase family protein [Planctomycetota bacterium]